MSSKRKAIREAFVDLLTNETDAEDRVYSNRVRPIWRSKLPAILVFSRNEPASIFAESPREMQRELTLSVEIMADANDSLDNSLDVIAEQVETLLDVDHTLGELCHDVVLESTEMVINRDGDTLYGSCILNYKIIYHRVAANSVEDLEYLERVDTTYQTDNPASAEFPTDIVTGLADL